MVDDIIRAHLLDPLSRVGTRCGGNDGQPGELLCQLNQDRANTAGGADHEQRFPCAFSFYQPEAVEQNLPRRDAGQGHRGGFGETEGRRFPPHDTFIDNLKLGVGTGVE